MAALAIVSVLLVREAVMRSTLLDPYVWYATLNRERLAAEARRATPPGEPAFGISRGLIFNANRFSALV